MIHSHSVKQWYRQLTRIARRVTVITPHAIMRRFWKGSASYLQEKWVEKGWNPEDPNLHIESLYESALRFERARQYQKAEEARQRSQRGRTGRGSLLQRQRGADGRRGTELHRESATTTTPAIIRRQGESDTACRRALLLLPRSRPYEIELPAETGGKDASDQCFER